jgi:signal transduction histidine kinase
VLVPGAAISPGYNPEANFDGSRILSMTNSVYRTSRPFARCLWLALVLLALLASASLWSAETRVMVAEDFGESWRWRKFAEETFGQDVTALAHEHNGGIYVGVADSAIYRYDGYLWTRITTGPREEFAPPDPIHRILVSGRGTGNTRIYAISDRGLWRMVGKVELVLVRPGRVFLAAPSHDGGVVLIDANGQVVVVEKDGEPKPFRKPVDQKYHPLHSFVIDVEEVHWLASDVGLLRREPGKALDVWKEDVHLPLDVKDIRCTRILSVPYVSGRHGAAFGLDTPELWALFEPRGGERTLIRHFPSTGDSWKQVDFDGPTPAVSSVTRDGLGNYYLIDTAGQLFFSVRGDRFESVASDQLGIAAESLRFGVQDSHGFNWFAYQLSGQRGGAARFDPHSDRWTAIPFADGVNRAIRSLLHTEARDGTERLWVACKDGVHRSDEHGAFQPLQDKIGDTELLNISTLAQDIKGKVWIGSASNFPDAFFFDPDDKPGAKTGFRLKKPYDDIPQYIKRIVPGWRHTLWFLPVERKSADRYTVFSLEGGNFYMPPEPKEISLGGQPMGKAMDLVQTRAGDVILATDHGLVSERGETWTKDSGLIASSISRVLEAPDSSIWVCYFDAFGVTRIGPDGQLQHFDHSNGLPNPRVWSITSTGGGGDDSFVWFGTGDGITRFDGATLYNYRIGGLHQSVGLALTRSATQDRTVYLGTHRHGVYRLRLDDRRKPRVYPPDIVALDEDGSDNAYRFTLHGRDFEEQTRADELLFRSRLQGGSWSEFSTERTVIHRNLEPGDHVFVVEARDVDNNQVVSPGIRKFSVPTSLLLPAWIFWPLLILIAVLVVALLVALGKGVARLRDPLRKARHAFGNAAEAAFVLDLQGRIVSSNRAAIETLRLHGLGDRLRGLPVDSIAALPGGEVQSLVRAVTQGHAERGEIEEFEDGTGRVLRFRVVPVRGSSSSSKVCGALLLVDDCTRSARQRATTRRRQRMGAVRDLAGRIHAEIDESLACISTGLERLAAASESPSRSEWEALEKQSEMLSDLAGSLKHFVGRDRDADRVELSTSQILDGLIGGGANGDGVLPPEVRVDYRAQPGLWHVHVERDAVRDAMVAVLHNCSDAMPDGGSVVVRLTNHQLDESDGDLAPGRYVEISIRDAGPGIDRVQLERIFDPLFTTKSTARHRGLGLSFAYGVVRRQGGDIRVQSEGGEGTTVRILLPAQG